MTGTRTLCARVVALAVAASVLLVAPSAAVEPRVEVSGNSPVGRDVFPGEKPASLSVYDPGRLDPATVVWHRSSSGARVRTMSVDPYCFFDQCAMSEGSGFYDGYLVEWDGTGDGGVVRPAGAYTGRIIIKHGAETETFALGTVWIDHLVTRRPTLSHPAYPDPSLVSVSFVGRCSSVAGHASGTPWNLRLLSLSRCRSSAGSDDWAFSAQRLSYPGSARVHRLLSVRVGARGAPVSKGDVARVVVDSSAGTAAAPTWRRVAVLRKRGTHLGDTFTIPAGSIGRGPYELLIQGRVMDGDRYRIANYVATWTFRSWAR